MKKQNKIVSAIAILLLSVFAFTFVASAAVYDYELDASSKNEAVDAARLLDEYLGFEVDEKEKAFLDKFTKFELYYNPVINTGKVIVDYSGGTLSIKAMEYTYKADSGKTFVWKPSYAEIGSTRVQLSDAGEGNVNIPEPSYETEIKVTYIAVVDITKEDINSFVNLYRYTAEYANDIERYNEQSIEYDNYCLLKALYDDAYSEYIDYLDALEQYKKDKLAYDNFKAAVNQFKKDQEAFTKYEQKLEDYNDALIKYDAYLKNLAPFEKKLNALKLIDVSMTSLQRTVYSAVMGGTVDQVLVNESAIIAAGAEKAAVHQAGDATEVVRGIMTGFKACKTDAEKYSFYVQNYDTMCDGFLKLTQALDILYRNKLVRAKLVQEDKNEKYVILVCQLALVTNAIVDGELRDYKGNVAYNSTWKIDNRTIKQILGSEEYYKDDNTSKPGNDPYPQYMEEPKEPQKVEKPTYPQVVNEPSEPDFVADPGKAPDEVLKPEPVETKQAEVLPIYKKLKENERAEMARVFENGEVPSLRNEYSEDLPLEITSAVTKKYGVTPIVVTFRVRDEESADGYRDLVLNVDPGSPVVYEGETPENYTDETGEYELVGWKIDGVDGAIDLTKGFSEDTLITPLYDRAPTYYNVTWKVNDEEITENLISGIVPECPIELEKPEDNNAYYTFSGWVDEIGRKVELTELIEDSTYEAVFEKHYIVEATATKGAEITYDGGTATCDAGKFIKSSVNVEKLFDRLVEKRSSLVLILPKGTLKFTFKDVYEMKNAGVQRIELAYSGNTNKLNVSLRVLKNDGELYPVKTEVKLNHAISDTNRYKLVEYKNDASSVTAYTSQDATLIFNAESGSEYVFRKEYSLIVIPNELVDITASVERFDKQYGVNDLETVLERDTLFVDFKAKEGVDILDIIITDSEGNRIETGENGDIKIKNSDVFVEVKAKLRTYTITFTANGKVISMLEVAHGAAVTPPTPPKIASDGKYSYEFLMWDKEVTDAVSDASYDALYEKTLIPIVPDEGGIKLSPRLKKLFYMAVAAAAVVVVLIITLICVLIVKKVKNKSYLDVDYYYDDD